VGLTDVEAVEVHGHLQVVKGDRAKKPPFSYGDMVIFGVAFSRESTGPEAYMEAAAARHRSLALVLALAIAIMVVFALGCGAEGRQLGAGTTVNLNQLWGMAAQEETVFADGAILAQFEMTLSPVQGNALPPEQRVRVDQLHLVAWARGPVVQVTATWPEKGTGQLSTDSEESSRGPMPVGSPLADLFSSLDYVGMSALFDALRPYAGDDTVRLRLVYPPPAGSYGEQWNVPLLVLRGRSLEVSMSADVRTWAMSAGVFQVFPASGEKLLAIVLIPGQRLL